MPELPEVETIIRGLEKKILGQTFSSFRLLQPKLRQNVLPLEIEPCLQQPIVSLRRMGKYFFLDFANSYSLLFHLGMSGQFFLTSSPDAVRHKIIVFNLNCSWENRFLVLADARRFGLLRGMPSSQLQNQTCLKKLGCDALAKNFSPRRLFEKALRTERNIKDFLMDQSVISGLGNIYTCELLFRLRLHPQTPAKALNEDTWKNLVKENKKLLRFAINKQGSSVSDYVTGGGEKGGFQFFFSVYQKENQPCANCQTLIAKITQSGRSTFYCPACQKK